MKAITNTISTPQHTPIPTEARWQQLARTLRAWKDDAVVRKGVPAIFDQAVVSGTSFATSVILGRLCTQAELGVYFLVLSVVFFAIGIQGEIICGPYTIFCHRREGDHLATYAGSVLVHQLLLSGLCMLGILGLCGLLAAGIGPREMLPVALVMLGAFPLLLMRSFVRQMALAHLHLRSVLRIDVAASSIQLAGLAGLAWFGFLSISSVYGVMAVGCAVATAGWLFARDVPLRISPPRLLADWRENWTIARWSLLSEMLGSTTPYILPWLLALTHGTAATGVLAVCVTLVGLSNCFLLGVSNFLIPRAASMFSQGGVPALRDVLLKSTAMIVAALSGFFLMFLFAGEWIVVTVYGSQYAGCGPVISVLALSLLGTGVGMAIGNGLYAIEQQRANLAADFFLLVVTLLVAFAIVPGMGTLGAAIASLAGVVVGTTVRCLSLVRKLRELENDPVTAGGIA